MILATCQHEHKVTWGTTKAGTPRLRCKDCGKMTTESTEQLNGLPIGLDRAAQVITLLCEGKSIRATCRITGVCKDTVLDRPLHVGPKCDDYMRDHIKGVFVDEVQVDEIGGFVSCKAATAKRMKYVGGCGDCYCYTALERPTKLLVCWHMGRRNEQHTDAFISKLERATTVHFHISSDGWKSYLSTIKRNLGPRVDHGVMTNVYRRSINYPISASSPARIIGAHKTPLHGDFYQQDKICTSHVERHNLTIRTFVKE